MILLPPYRGYSLRMPPQKPRYPVIVADPPWDFTTYSDKAQRSAKKHYGVMPTGDIARLDVAAWAAADAILLLWATWPNLLDAIRVGSAWGFTYKTLGFVWLKRTSTASTWHMGLGYYTRANSEPCLLFTRGATLPRQSMGVHQIIDDNAPRQLTLFENTLVAPIRRHSEKPPAFYEAVESLVAGPYLSIFERKDRPGWKMLGNEIDGRDIRDVLGMRPHNVPESPHAPISGF